MKKVACVGILVADVMVSGMNGTPNKGELARVDTVTIHNGGNAMTAAINLTKLGVETRMVGRVGTDLFGEFLEKNPDAELYYFSAKGEICYADVEYPDNSFLVFGRESVGLPKELVMENFDRSVRIPMRKTLRCLNLSNSVAIAVYELLRQKDFVDLE